MRSRARRPPRLKQIKGGRPTGMTDVNPQWRYRAMTETFGPCGYGWRFDIVRTWTEPGTEGRYLPSAKYTRGGGVLITGTPNRTTGRADPRHRRLDAGHERARRPPHQ